MIDVVQILNNQDKDKRQANVFSETDSKNETYLIKAKEKLEQYFNSLQTNTTYHFATAGRWSAFELLNYFLTISGPATVHLTAWKINEMAARLLFKSIQSGLIKELHCIIDRRMPIKSPEALDLVKTQAASFYLVDCHAKVFVIQNDSWSISCSGSANLTINPRIEAGTVSTCKSVADFHLDWILKEIQHGKPFGR